MPKILDKYGRVKISPDLPEGQQEMVDSIPVVIASDQSPIPITGSIEIDTANLATSALQTTGNISLVNINTKLPSGLTVSGGKLQVELPAGGTGLTDTELRASAVPISNSSLSNLDSKTPALGQALAAASTPIVLTAAQLITLTPPAGFATSALQGTSNTSLSSIDGKTPSLGQALSTGSTPVVLTAAQLITLTPPGAISGYATAAKQDLQQATLDLHYQISADTLNSVTGILDIVDGGIINNRLIATDGILDDSIYRTSHSLNVVENNSGTINSTLTSLNSKVTAVNTGAVVVSSSALPTGASTSALQGTGNTSLGSIDTKIPALGQALAAASVPVVLTAAQLSTLTPLTGFATSAKQDTLLAELQLKADLTETQPVSAASLPLPSGAATSSKQDSQTSLLTTIDGDTSNLDVALSTRLKAADTLTAVGTITNVVHVDDNAGSLTVDGIVAISAGSALIGKVGIDQTTPGTTNKVNIGTDGTIAINTALPAGTNVIGHVIADSGSTTVVTGNVTVVQGTATNLKVDASGVAIPITDNSGSITVDNAGTFLTQESASSLVSTNNSTTTPLSLSAIYTGTADEITDYSSVTIAVYSDTDSAIDGLSVQQSINGTNWDILDAYTIPANIGKTFGVQVSGRYLRVVYTNGITTQGVFRIQTLLHKYAQRNSSIRPQDSRSNENDSTEVISYLSGYNNNGTWDRLRTSITNGLQVDVMRTSYGDYQRRFQEEQTMRSYLQNMIGLEVPERASAGAYGFELR